MLHKTIIRLLLIAFGLCLGGNLSAMGFDDPEFIAVQQVQERYTDMLLSINGVVGTAVGLDEQKHLAIHVYVTDASVTAIPTMLDDKKVHVIVTGPIRAFKTTLKKPSVHTRKVQVKVNPKVDPKVDPRVRFTRPVPIGVSTGHLKVTAGTLGCLVTNGTNLFALSNNHVYANENEASIGDVVLQPGTYDGGKVPADVIGTLAQFVEIHFDKTNNTVDAAIALTDSNLVGKATYSGGYGMPQKLTAAPVLQMAVKKCGRTTGCTKGSIQGLNATLSIEYSEGSARFINQIVIGPGKFSAPGDSGSLIVTDSITATDDRRPVGLLFAGSDTITIANPIDAVLSAFNVSIDGE